MIDEAKYDRQLRLWAKSGQQTLESSHVCLVNASAVGCETLKNLVLPNVGKITIADSSLVTELDLSCNFFFSESQLGASRAISAKINLEELNPSVVIDTCDSISDLDWSQFSLVVWSQSFEDSNLFRNVVNHIYGVVPVLQVSSVGLYGLLRIFNFQTTIIETHSSESADLRIDCPWPELQEAAASVDIESSDIEYIKDIPFILLLIRLRAEYIAAHGTKPSRKMFKVFVEEHPLVKRVRHAALDNIEELISYSWRGTTATTIPSKLKTLISRSSKEHQTPFWILVQALGRFVELHGVVPFSGKLIDMESSTEAYIALQKIYKDKYEADKVELRRLLSYPVDDSLLESFCKNCRYIQVQDGPSSQNLAINDLNLSNPITKNEAILLGFTVLDKSDIKAAFFSHYGDIPEAVPVLEEFIRCKSRENVNISSLMGGLGGQEALKLLTNQYTPLDNILIFDGIESSLKRWKV